jgi:hypothetical protein
MGTRSPNQSGYWTAKSGLIECYINLVIVKLAIVGHGLRVGFWVLVLVMTPTIATFSYSGKRI